MPRSIDIGEFISLSSSFKILDVRSPGEFFAGHIPGAFSLPLFSDEERAKVGTLYVQQGRKQAVEKGLDFFGVKMNALIEQVKNISANEEVLCHCWRGGMRSAAIAWLLEVYGFKVNLLNKGYKSFRNFCLNEFEQKKNVLILGGMTGSGKTKILHALKNQNEQMIDLENLAHHKGSSFGALGEPEPPTQEQFENDLAMQWHHQENSKTLWLEDESRSIGRKILPAGIWNQMREAQLILIDIPFEERVKYLVEDYGKFPVEKLIEATERIERRLGPQHAKKTVELLRERNLFEAFSILLHYYDKAYLHNIEQRMPASIHKISFEKMEVNAIAGQVMEFVKTLKVEV